MEQQRQRARAAQKKTVVKALDLETKAVTEFLGFEHDSCEAKILELHQQGEQCLLITDQTVLFTEMGGQEGDHGTLESKDKSYPILATQKVGNAVAHCISYDSDANFKAGDRITLVLNRDRRTPIEAHHTATHLLHWALHKLVSPDATQQGSSVSADRLRFDFNSKALEPSHISALEHTVNECIQKADAVSWSEVPHREVKDRTDVMQFFGDKYGEQVRVVQIGGTAKALDGYSMELCGGTHVRNTAEIGLFKIKSEGAIAAGIRRIEALCGKAAEAYLEEQQALEAKTQSTNLEKIEQLNAALTELGMDPVTIPTEANAETLKRVALKRIKSLKSPSFSRRQSGQCFTGFSTNTRKWTPCTSDRRGCTRPKRATLHDRLTSRTGRRFPDRTGCSF